MSRSALFLDRDGTLIVDVGYPRDPDGVTLVEGAADALRALQRDFALVIISNQSGIGRGIIRDYEAAAVHERVIERFQAAGVTFAGAYYCPHAPQDHCRCRKPAPGLIEDAVRELDLDLSRSFMIGDKPSDLDAGRSAGCRYLVRFGSYEEDGDASAQCAEWAEVRAFIASTEEPG